MLKKLFIIFALLFMASSTAFADGIVPVICSMGKFNYCKDIKKIIEYTPEGYHKYEAYKIYTYANNTVLEYTPEGYNKYEAYKIYTYANNTIIEYTPEGYHKYEAYKIFRLYK